MKFFAAVLFLGAFSMSIGMPEKILAQRRTSLLPPGPHEKFLHFGPACERTCADKSPVCPNYPAYGNYCVEGYIREYENEDEDGPCILESECPQRGCHRQN